MNDEEKSTLNIESKLLPSSNKTNKRFTTCQMIIIVILAVILTGLLTNIDRLIEWVRGDSNTSDTNEITHKYDIVIVGGGSSGLTSMNLLQYDTIKNNINSGRNVLLIEKLSILGGRSYSPKLKFKNNTIHFENCAMRSYYHPLQWKMFYYLNLCNDIIPFQNINQTYNPNIFIRNSLIKSNQLNQQNYYNNIFNFNDIDNKILFDRQIYGFNSLNNLLWNDIIYENKNGNFNFTEDDYESYWYNWTLKGILLHKWTADDIRRFYLNNFFGINNQTTIEYYNRINYGFYHRTSSIAYNLFAQFTPLPFNISGEYQQQTVVTLRNGFGSIPNGLYNNLTDEWKENIWLSNELKGIEYNENGNDFKYKLILYDRENKNVSYILTNKIILSIPEMDLKNLLPYMKPIDSDETLELINSGSPTFKYSKINFIYDTTVNSSFWDQNFELILILVVQQQMRKYHNVCHCIQFDMN